MRDATFSQGFQINKLFHDQNPTFEEMQDLIESGLIPAFFEAKRSGKSISPNNVRKMLGLEIPNVLESVEPKIVVPAIGKFVAKDNFVVNTGKKTKVKIPYLGNNFQKWFLDKVEEDVPETTLSSRRVLKWLEDKEIIAGVGGEILAETRLTQVFYLISQQSNGEEGVLLANGYANIFYVRDVDSLLRPVGVFWDGDGWGVDAYSVGVGWVDDDRVFSRSS